ncbi:DUF742 domain-containing protein [Prauserella oleivorans]|uniref:DUF742 domain-containing protein n=1 Tax=Prauserella oleivorans TaxID=1478153 RepID=A0ABW5WI02_9PSEU
MGTPDENADQAAERAVGRAGARFPSAKQRAKLGIEEPQEPTGRRTSAGTGARFPSAKQREALEHSEPEPPLEDTDRGRKRKKKDRSRVGRSGARFPSAKLLEQFEEHDEPEQRHDDEAADAVEPPEPPAEPAPEPQPQPAEPPGPGTRRERVLATPDEEYDALEEHRLRVRPYVITRGRTEARDDLALETLISTNPDGPWHSQAPNAEYQAVRSLCRQPRSVAEVAALLWVPLGVARVLLSDLADAGLVQVHAARTSLDGRPDFALMQRVLEGLHRL